MPKRVLYAKEIAQREQIFSRALELVARTGRRTASLREIAESVGLGRTWTLARTVPRT
jgi:AcrR family transcriptional regulator